VQLGRLAAERGSSDAVKKFGERMAADHGKANDELAQLAQQKGITLPTDLGASDQRTYERLSNRSGADFDREYMKDMVRDHDKDVKAFEREAKNAKDPDLKAWAEKTVPVLHEHQQQAHQLQASVKDGKASARARSHESSPSASPPSERTK
jgi:putative membrane protein